MTSTTNATQTTPPGYSPSPRPAYERPTLITRRDVRRHIWGDREAGYVADWVYASGSKLHMIMFGLAAGRSFKHSPAYRTIFGADETLLVQSGTMALTNPATGEVAIVKTGESAVFGPGTWHHAAAHNNEPLRVIEFFAPPPSTGTSGPYAAAQPYLHEPTTVRNQLLGHLQHAASTTTLRIVRDADLSWRDESGLMIGLICSTAELTTAIVEINPGLQAEPTIHGGDALLIGLEGNFHVRAEMNGVYSTYEVDPLDGVFMPEGTTYEILSFAGAARAVLGVAPRYLPQ